ncbi:hypothetical protein DFJ63DRAFT_311694 [Scheffersomyces coipomensis]|uniref:uncharacterized protein n=1 Tax=Scheffersomyces coipomensis TaxID=1788519 RepID=UPI00315D9811
MTSTTITTTSIPNEEQLKKILESQHQKLETLQKSLESQKRIVRIQSSAYSSLKDSLDFIKSELSHIKTHNKYGFTINKLIWSSKPPPEYTEHHSPSIHLLFNIKKNSSKKAARKIRGTIKCKSESMERIRLEMFDELFQWHIKSPDRQKVEFMDKTLAEIENDLNILTKTDSKYSEKLSRLINQGQPPPKYFLVAGGKHNVLVSR